ncbi:fibronectin type III domain-containing protein [Mycobacterium heckeshornense]|uniref:fibronectin type III domain-containing protein n=1 Tax=Mycobacterium heckeshornense TaxID=110505 RepID=UPI0008FCF790|nr:fibronectin type III domain-containing protein [Mycobacterium heckeshornense]PIJ36735.1 fibronectin type III domain-containing protein [Mycobacterium heckeshornense]PIJ36786.1 fibronectin type III domain-containing protein [Mycobacterium heckeshornense]
MALPATGGTWAQVLEDNLNPLNVRYWQITHGLIRDYDPTGVFNLASPAVGLGTVQTVSGPANLFTPFAADNVSIRNDLLVTSPNSPVNFYDLGLLKEDATDWTPDQTLQETPSAQLVRTVRNVLTKLDDKVNFTPLESNPYVDDLRYELPLGTSPALGSPGYGVARGNVDVPRERTLVLIGIDTDANLISRVFPRIITDKKGKNELGRKNPDASELTYQVLPDPFTKQTMWVCRAGKAWLGAGNLQFETAVPTVTPVTGLKATITFPTPIDITSPVYSVQIQQTPNGAWSAATLSGSPSVSGGLTTLTISGLTASTTYNAVQVTATGSNATVTGPASAPFTSTDS